ncbi:MAG TPA: EamA family transporter [Marmoricola sp.]
MVAILLALLSAASYGVSDFIGGLVSRRVSAWSVAVVGQVSATLCTALAAVVLGGTPSEPAFLWAGVGGVASGIGTGFLYRGFSTGRMGVVAPISAVGSAVVPMLAGVATGERPGPVVWVGLVLAAPAIWLVSSTPGHATGATLGSRASGAVDGVLAGLGFGGLFACLGQVPAGSGMWPLALAQLISVPAVIAIASGLRAPWRPRDRQVGLAALTGPFGAGATVLFLLATHHGFLTVTGVLASLYPAATVLLAARVLREPIHRAQAGGLVLCAVSVALVIAG